jgi:uncharacterized phage-associated protein
VVVLAKRANLKLNRHSMDISDLAKWFLAKEPMTHKKLQKLCYYAVAWGWALMGKSIVSNDRFEAWVHGPVAPRLYNAYRENGWNDIPQVNRDNIAEIQNDVEELLESVWLTYGDKSGNELEALSHSERPWVEARVGLAVSQSSHNPISSNTMIDFYNSIKSADF